MVAKVHDGIGHLTLDRPRALNAIDLGMVRALTVALDAWMHDTDVEVVLLDGAGGRGLCAGGDVRALYEQVVAGDAAATGEFFRAEYALNALIAEYPKPVVALADGITSLTTCRPGSVASGIPTIAFQPSLVRTIGARYLP